MQHTVKDKGFLACVLSCWDISPLNLSKKSYKKQENNIITSDLDPFVVSYSIIQAKTI